MRFLYKFWFLKKISEIAIHGYVNQETEKE